MHPDLPDHNHASVQQATRRLFWGVGLDAAGAAFAAAERARLEPDLAGVRALRWQTRENWHLTLLFMGQMPLPPAQSMADVLRGPLTVLAPFSVPLTAAGWFPSRQHPLVIALPAASTAPLRALVSLLAQTAREAGVPHEARPFRGHVTIARVRRGFRPRDELPPAAGTAGLRIDRIALYESASAETGTRYRPLLELPLGAG